MTTEAQLLAWAEAPAVDEGILAYFKHGGLTADEAYLASAPEGAYFDHASVDSFRVQLRWLREHGKLRDSGEKRRGASSGRLQTVWVLGDDRHLVEWHRRRKLEKFPTPWLQDEIDRRRP